MVRSHNLRQRLQASWDTGSRILFQAALDSVRDFVMDNPPQIIRPPNLLIHHFFDQLYDRAVIPYIRGLKSAREEGVYGEIRPPFLSEIFQKLSLSRRDLRADMVAGWSGTRIISRN